MNRIAYIRKTIFGASQVVFGQIAGTTQTSVSRWELPEGHPDRQEPSREQLEAIRNDAIRRGLQWDDSWFFDPPGPAPRSSEPLGAPA